MGNWQFKVKTKIKVAVTKVTMSAMSIVSIVIFLVAPALLGVLPTGWEWAGEWAGGWEARAQVLREPKGLREVQELDSFYNDKVDYSKLEGRVTDRDKSASILKIYSQNGNIKFLATGDELLFKVGGESDDYCKSYVRALEKNYVVIYVQDLHPCWKRGRFLRRGTILKIKSPALAKRVQEAAKYRVVLLKRRRDFLRQLGEINHFLWSFDQQKVLTASDFDRKILALKAAQGKALDALILKKKGQIHLQRELGQRLDALDSDLEHFRVEAQDNLGNRWERDHDLGLPMSKTPPTLKHSMHSTHSTKRPSLGPGNF